MHKLDDSQVPPLLEFVTFMVFIYDEILQNYALPDIDLSKQPGSLMSIPHYPIF